MWWMSRWFWIPMVCVFYFIYGLLSYKNNSSDNMMWFWFLYAFGGVIQLWAFVSKVSKNIIFDSFLYDLCMMLSLSFAIIVVRGILPTPLQFVGVACCLIGLMLLR
jgi:hypothetical protein